MKKLNYKKLIVLFTLGGTVGWVLETVFCLIKYQHYIPKKGMILGIFKPLYGYGLIIFYLVYLTIKKQNIIKTFTIGTIAGTIYEYLASLFETHVLRTNTWDYNKFNFNLNGRIYLPYSIFWGILFLISCNLFPMFDYIYHKYIENQIINYLITFLTIFMSLNMLLTTSVFLRYSMRHNNIKPLTFIGEVIDYKYNDKYIKENFPRLKVVK